MKTIYQYLDYRQYLRDYYEEKKRTTKSFSYRSFARSAGLVSATFLNLVIKGKRNLTPDSIRKFCKGLKLKRDEAAFFENLVLMNQATTPEDKNFYYQRLATSKKYLAVKRLERDQYECFSKWYSAAIWELLSLKGFQNDPQWIARKLVPRITTRQAREVIETFLRLRLVAETPEGGLVKRDPHLTTPNEVKSMAIGNFHRDMLCRAADAVSTNAARDRELSSLTIAISKKRFVKAKRRIQEFRRELHELLAGDEDPDSVYQCHISLFHLSEVPDEA